jgi:V8-like Glu-specific endopeptidase
MRANILAAGLILVGCASATEVSAQYSSAASGRVMVYTPPQSASEPDYANAKPVPLPKPTVKPSAGPTGETHHHATPLLGKPVVVPGARGDGKESPESVPAQKNSGVGSEDAGPTCGIICQFPFTTNRVDAYFTTTTKYYPFRAAGKLFFDEPGGSFVCSASLIAPGLVVTAGHCVANYGAAQFYSN